MGEWVDFTSKVVMMKNSGTDCRTSSPVLSKKKHRRLDTIIELKEKWNGLRQTLRPVTSLSASEIEHVLSLFGLNVCFSASFINSHRFHRKCDHFSILYR